MKGKGKNTVSADQKKLIALALVGGLAWGGYTLYQTLEKHFARLPVVGSIQVPSANQVQNGLTHLAPVQISAGNQTNQALVDSINTKNALKTLNRKAFEAPRPRDVVKPVKIDIVPIVEAEEVVVELTPMERFMASGPHNLLELQEEHKKLKLNVTFPEKDMAIINGQLVSLGDTLAGFTYAVPDLEGGEASKPIQRTVKLTRLTSNAAVLEDTWNDWNQFMVIRLNPINVPVTGEKDDIIKFYKKIMQ